jgi:hypothetical protein
LPGGYTMKKEKKLNNIKQKFGIIVKKFVQITLVASSFAFLSSEHAKAADRLSEVIIRGICIKAIPHPDWHCNKRATIAICVGLGDFVETLEISEMYFPITFIDGSIGKITNLKKPIITMKMASSIKITITEHVEDPFEAGPSHDKNKQLKPIHILPENSGSGILLISFDGITSSASAAICPKESLFAKEESDDDEATTPEENASLEQTTSPCERLHQKWQSFVDNIKTKFAEQPTPPTL